MKRIIFFLIFLVHGIFPVAFANDLIETPPPSSPSLNPTPIQLQIEEVQAFYEQKYITLQKQVSEEFQVNYKELVSSQQSAIRELNFKMSLVNQMEDLAVRAVQLDALKKEYPSEDIQKAMEVYYYFQNAIEEDHAFVGQLLSKLEAILAATIEEDPLFRYVFKSDEFRSQYGLVLKRVVWQIQPGEEVSGQTVPLSVHSIFADKTKTPLLIKLTPVAFKSHAFLKSILLHELNHVMMFKDERFLNAKKFEGNAVTAANGPFSHYFKQLSPSNPTYQFYLIHEYYSFKAQMLFDEEWAPENLKLDKANRAYFEKALDWTRDQLHGKNKEFIVRNPDPSIVPWLNRFYIRPQGLPESSSSKTFLNSSVSSSPINS